MCRHLAYLGPPVRLDALVLDPSHSLLVQASSPRHQIGTHDNPHGFGVGWFDGGDDEPRRYRTAKPMWADDAFGAVAARERAGAVVAAVRHASPGAAVDERGNAPFVGEGRLFSHNGFVRGYREGIDAAIRARTSARRLASIEGDSDSEALFALVLDNLDDGSPLEAALVRTIEIVREYTDGPLNLLVADGRAVAATAAGNSLFTRQRDAERVVASEPFDDDPDWTRVTDESVVVADSDGIRSSTI
jgi:glutamine amidotransferase